MLKKMKIIDDAKMDRWMSFWEDIGFSTFWI